MSSKRREEEDIYIFLPSSLVLNTLSYKLKLNFPFWLSSRRIRYPFWDSFPYFRTFVTNIKNVLVIGNKLRRLMIFSTNHNWWSVGTYRSVSQTEVRLLNRPLILSEHVVLMMGPVLHVTYPTEPSSLLTYFSQVYLLITLPCRIHGRFIRFRCSGG